MTWMIYNCGNVVILSDSKSLTRGLTRKLIILARVPVWWKKRSKLERLLLVLLICSLLTIGSLLSCMHIILHEEEKLDNLLTEQTVKDSEVVPDDQSAIMNSEVVCTTPECIHTASKVLEYMNPNVDPCDDFYDYACGNFMQNIPIPDDQGDISTFSIAQDEIWEKLRKVMDTETDTNEEEESRQLRIFYRSCMDEASIERKGVQPLLELLETYGGWPVIKDDWDESKFNWTDFIRQTMDRHLPSDYFPRLLAMRHQNESNGADGHEESWTEVSTQPQTQSYVRLLMVPVYSNFVEVPNKHHAESYKTEEARLLKAYQNFMIDIAVALGADKENATKELQETLDFEKSLIVKVRPSLEQGSSIMTFGSPSYTNRTTMREIINTYPSVPWMEYIRSFGQNITEDDIVILDNPKTLEEFAKLMKETTKRTVANYAMWRLIFDLIGHVGGKIQDEKLKYLKEMYGITEQGPRWRHCLKNSIDKLIGPVEQLYAKEYSEDIRRNVSGIIDNIRQEFKNTVKELGWLDAEAKNATLEKLDSMCTIYGAPAEWIEIYESLNMSEHDYFGNILNLAGIGLFNQRSWYRSSLEINAYAIIHFNCINLPFSILQSAFFNEEKPQYMNYGRIGFMIGHEVSHGFDNNGIRYNASGDPSDWLKNGTKEEYLRRSQCIVNQYGNYTDEDVELMLDGENIKNENIADNSGIKWAYMAYENWVLQNGPELLLPGLNITQQQMFWISYAQLWCEKNQPESLKRQIISDKHSPGHFRVIGTLANMAEFSRDFECPIGSRMNPEVKCTVW